MLGHLPWVTDTQQPCHYVISTVWKVFSCLFQAREQVIRSQFACTYKDEELPLNRVLEFPSSSQVPTCVHPAPKPKIAPGVEEEEEMVEEEDTAAGKH